ncbi:MAG: pentapeptide repeat-containing protein [Cytophagaceae bacterium]
MLNSNSIGNKIAVARKKINMSQAELAKLVSISPQAVGKWERGESMPDITTLNRLADIFGVDLNYFSDTTLNEAREEMVSHKKEPLTMDVPVKSNKKFDWNWDMSQGNWSDADFSGLRNLKEKFTSSNIKNCQFKNSDLSGLLIAKNNIERCDFSGSDFRDSKIQFSNLLSNQFQQCSFIDAFFTKCNIEKCTFDAADFSGLEFMESNLESITLDQAVWKFTKFNRSNISKVTFSGRFEDCHFEHCTFYQVTFENAILTNTFFKYNDRFKKVQFINCQVDSITFAFLKNNQADLTGVTLIS